ncbi:MAG TPA: hypothetical protein VHE78_10015 [Gemmatimonadaceae bacterium]|nr:hypothetical protein [Gemmatimonadaceae bacterium]
MIARRCIWPGQAERLAPMHGTIMVPWNTFIRYVPGVVAKSP